MKITRTYENGETDTFLVIGIDFNNKQFFVYHDYIPCLLWNDDTEFDLQIDNNLIVPNYLYEDKDNKGVFLPEGLHDKNLKLAQFEPKYKFEFDSWTTDIWTKSKYLKIIDSLGVKIYEPHYKYIDKGSVGLAIQT